MAGVSIRNMSHWTPIVEPPRTRPEDRPPAIGWLLSRTWQIYRANAPLLLGLSALVQVPVALLVLPAAISMQQAAVDQQRVLFEWMATLNQLESRDPGAMDTLLEGQRRIFDALSPVLASSALITGLGAFAGILSAGMVARAVLIHEEGQPLSFRSVLSSLGGPWLSLLALAVAVGLFMGLLGGGWWVLASGAFGSADDPLDLLAVALVIVLGALIVLVLGILALVRWCLAVPVLVAEELGPLRAIARSAALTRGVGWEMVGIIFVSFLIVALISAVPALFIAPLQFEAFITRSSPALAVSLVLVLVLQLLLAPVVPTILTLTYRHLAHRRATPAPAE